MARTLRNTPSLRTHTRLVAGEISYALAGIALTVLLCLVTGCGAGSSRAVQATAISATLWNGPATQITALPIGAKAQLSMAPTGDVAGAGLDWRVTCGGNPVTGGVTNGACGTFSPAHTGDGAIALYTAPSAVPVGLTVSITATLTGNPSQSSSLNLTIVAPPEEVQFAISAPASLQINKSATLAASVTNDPSSAGVIWTASCASAACGSFNPVTTAAGFATAFTAPSAIPTGDAVTVTATSLADTTKSAGATITITSPPPAPPAPIPIAVSLQPANIYVQKTGPGRTAKLTPLVVNDATNAGVDLTLSCSTSNCGSISGHASSGTAASFQNTSTVPVGGTINITARSTSDPTKTAVATATVVSDPPATAAIASSLPTTMNTGAQATLQAAASVSGGLDWSVICGSPGACGGFNLSPAHTADNAPIIYTAPSTVPTGSVVTITASSTGAPIANVAVTSTTVLLAPPPAVALGFTQSPPASLVATSQAPVSVTVANDRSPGGVAWSLKCNSTLAGGCGWVSPATTASGATATYTAPPVSGTSVQIVATSIADPTLILSSKATAITPDTTLSVHFIPSLPSSLQTDGSVALNAAVTNDATHAGIDWRVCSSGCGFFIIQPAQAAIPATANTFYVPPVPAVTATSVSAWPSGTPISYVAPSQVPANGLVSVAAFAHADPSTANSGTIGISAIPAVPVLNGTVQAGNSPVVGATVTLYAAGSTGYGSASSQLVAAVATDKSGNFTIPAAYSCPQSGSPMYLVATGGAVGQSQANTQLAFMTILGKCNGLSSAPVVLNEITTVASAFVAAPFAANDALNGNLSYLYIGSSSTNSTGLANAFATIHNLVDVSTGRVRFNVPAENAAVPYVEINTLANVLNACAASAGGAEGDGSHCSILLKATDLLGTGTYASSIAPLDTLQAIFNIAQHPASNYGYQVDRDQNHPLLSLATTTSPFQPILEKQPGDWSIALNFTSGGGLTTGSVLSSFAIDASGNLWVSDSKAGSVIEWNPQGAALSPATGFVAGGSQIAIDATNDVWISGDGALTVIRASGAPLPWSPFGGVPGGGSDAAFDKQGNLWIAAGNGLREFSNLGVEISPIAGFTLPNMTNVTAVGIDSLNEVWSGSGNGSSTGFIAQWTNPGGQLVADTGMGGQQYSPQMAADAQGKTWVVTQSPPQVCAYKGYAGAGSVLNGSCFGVGGVVSGPNALKLLSLRGVAVDGAGMLWLGGQGLTTPTTFGVLPVNAGADPANAVPYLSPGITAAPLRVAVDGSGNIWVLLANNTVQEYVGAAAPTVTPLALALSSGKVAAKP